MTKSHAELKPIKCWKIVKKNSPYHPHRFYNEKRAYEFYKKLDNSQWKISSSIEEKGYCIDEEVSNPNVHDHVGDDLLLAGMIVTHRFGTLRQKYYTIKENIELLKEKVKLWKEQERIIENSFWNTNWR